MVWSVIVIIFTVILLAFQVYFHVCVLGRMYGDKLCKYSPTSNQPIDIDQSTGVILCHDHGEVVASHVSLIVNAQTRVWLATYTFCTTMMFDHPVKHPDGKEKEIHLNPVALAYGYAFKKLQDRVKSENGGDRRRMDLRILYSSPHTHIEDIANLWSSMGVDMNDTRNWTWVFYQWKQRTIDNMHTKMFMVDDDVISLGSWNVEFSAHMGPREWGENGVILKSRKLNHQARKHFTNLCSMSQAKCRRPPFLNDNHDSHYFKAGGGDLSKYPLHTMHSTLAERMNLKTFYNRITAPYTSTTTTTAADITASVSIHYSYPNGNICNTEWNCEFDQLLNLIRDARNNIWIFTPNFHQITLCRAILDAAKRGVRVRIMTGREFNNNNDFIQKWGIGFCSNIDTWENHLKPALIDDPDLPLELKWYGYNGQVNVGHSTRMAHDKLVIVDDRTIVIGSFNFTVISVHFASEIIAIITSRKAARQCINEFADIRWNHGCLAARY